MGNRHPWNERVTTLLDQIAHGAAVQPIEVADAREGGALVQLPTWTWALSKIDVGAKDRGENGERLLLPVQISWQPAPTVLLAPGQSLELDYWAVGLGHTVRGSAVVRCDAEATRERVSLSEDDLPLPAEIVVPAVRPTQLRLAKARIVEASQLAFWQATEMFEPILASAVNRAERQISAEAFENGNVGAGRALDPHDLENIRNRMLLGDDEGPGAITRLINRCASSVGMFARVDPQRYILTSITRDAKAEVRKVVGDPHIGPKVRRLAIAMGTTDLAVLVPAYREKYPADNLSQQRAQAALGLWNRPTASHFSIQDTDMASVSFEDDVISSIDRARTIRAYRTQHERSGANVPDSRGGTVRNFPTAATADGAPAGTPDNVVPLRDYERTGERRVSA